MAKRRYLLAGNWKMYKTGREAVELVTELKSKLSGVTGVDVMIAPPFTALCAVEPVLRGSIIQLGAQNLFWEKEGAYTAEVSAPMLKDAGCSHVIIGHSERRQYFSETNETVNKKIKAALGSGLTPVVCVGETESQREAGQTVAVVQSQIKEGLKGFSAEEMSRMAIAYEPVWAIGTGKTATNDQAQEVHQFIRGLINEVYGNTVANGLRILYGGSVKSDNVTGLMSMTDIDGALVGGASLKADSFAAIVRKTAELV